MPFSWSSPVEPILVEEKRAHAEKLIREGYFADAIVALEGLSRDRSPEAREHAKWARANLPKLKAALQKSRAECREACVLAEQLFHDFEYAEAVEILEKFKRGSRSADAEELIKECKRALKKIAKLNEEIDRAIYRHETETDEFFDTLAELLNLDPKDRRAKELYKKLEKARHEESHLGWRLGLVALSLLCLVAVGWVLKLVFWPEMPGTITITLTEPGLNVFIDGKMLDEDDFDEKLDRYEAGDHRLELRRGLEVVARHTFTIEPNAHKILEVPGEEVVLESPAPAEPLPPDLPLEVPAEEVVRQPPQPLPDPLPMPEPMPMPIPEPMPVPEAPKINGFPIAKQTKYFHLQGPRVRPQHAAFSADSTRIVADRLTSDPIDPEKTYDILVWDSASGETVRTISTDGGELQGLAFSPDAKQLAGALVNSPEPNGGMVQIWNLETGALEQTLLLGVPPAQETVAVKGITFSPDGKMIGVINQDSAYVWTVADGKLHFQKSFAPSGLTSIAFFPVGQILILGTTTPNNAADGVISWDMERDAQRGLLEAGRPSDASHPVFAISNDLSVMTVLNENSIRRYAVENGRTLGSASLPPFLGEDEPMTRVSYSPGGQYVMASAPGRRPLIWQDSDFVRAAILGESSLVGSYAVKFSADSRFVFQLDDPDENDFAACAAVVRTWQIAD